MDKDIEIGLILPQGWLNDLSFDYDYIKRFALEADRLGFSLWAYDHFIPHYTYKPLEGKPMLECFTLLASIASITSNVKIGEVVTCNSYRNPSLLAKMISTLDFISNGRALLGIGAGWYKEEYLSYGYHFPNARVRIEQLDEALMIIRSMLEEGKSTFHGKYYNTFNALNYPKPKGKVPIMVGGYGKMLLKVAAKHADIYNCPFVSVDEYKDRLIILKDHCSIIGRDHNEIRNSLLIRVIIGKDEDDVRRKVSIIKDYNESVEDYIARNRDEAIIGDPVHVYKRLYEYVSIGVTHFILHVIPFERNLDSLKLLSLVKHEIV